MSEYYSSHSGQELDAAMDNMEGVTGPVQDQLDSKADDAATTAALATKADGATTTAALATKLATANNLSELNTSNANRDAARTSLDVLWSDLTKGWLSARRPRGASYFVSGTFMALTSAASSGIALGLNDWTLDMVIQWSTYHPGSLTTFWQSHTSGNSRVVLSVTTSGEFRIAFVDSGGSSTAYLLAPDVALVDGEIYRITITFSRTGSATLYVNSVSDRSRSGTPVSISIAASSSVDVGNSNSNAWGIGWSAGGTFFSFRIYNYLLSAASIQGMSGLVVSTDEWGGVVRISGATRNGNFETAGGGGSDTLGSWTETATGSSTITQDAVVFNGGAKSGKFTIDGSNSVATISQAALLNIGARYRAEFWAKPDSLTGTPKLATDSGGGTVPAVTLTSTSWTRYVIEFIATSNTFSLRTDTGCASRTINIDDLSVIQLGCYQDLDMENANQTNSLTLRDRSSNGLDGTISANTILQLNPIPQLNVSRLTIAGSAMFTGLLRGSSALDFPSISSQSSQELTITVTGASTGDFCIPAWPSTLNAHLAGIMYVSATNTVTVRLCNPTSGAIDPSSLTYSVIVLKAS